MDCDQWLNDVCVCLFGKAKSSQNQERHKITLTSYSLTIHDNLFALCTHRKIENYFSVL